MLTFQDLITKLTQFWADQGCIVHQGHDVEVGAGTFNPATFLRSLGPESYSTVYVEPSRRPQDARYGENPNRVHLFHQLQVLIKPSPKDIQQIYLKSLEAIGFDLSKHDIRFVHDDWESPTLGAWGLGWEVWMDGMEITQFTYFQSVGGQPLNPIPVELAYGLERIAMYIQDVDNMFDLKWNDTLTYGEVSSRNEFEWSHYNFNLANIEMWKSHFDNFEAEAKQLVEKGFPIPAYDFVMKASHAFNLLDSRGAISVTERTGYITRIRDLACLCAKGYVDMREDQNFPLLKEHKTPKETKTFENIISTNYDPNQERDFLLEIGSEELPASFVEIGLQSLEREIKKLLKDYDLSFNEVKLFATPRRLAIIVSELQEGTSDQTIERKGPPISSAFDDSGKLTKQGLGFFTSLKLKTVTLSDIKEGEVKELFVKEIKGTEYLFVKKLEKGHSTAQILSNNLPKLIEKIHFPKKMKWSDLSTTYARPIQWVVALFGKDIASFEIGSISSGRASLGHFQLDPQSFDIPSPSEYVKTLKDHQVIVDIEERKTSIKKQLQDIESSLQAKALETSRVLKEVLYLSEKPMLAVGQFKEEFLSAPKEILISEMVEHQRYFPLEKDTSLLAKFVITADNTPEQLIIKGNEKVLSARLSDGTFLFKEDIKKPLESYIKNLQTRTFHKDLGSVYDKALRLQLHAETLSNIFCPESAELCKRAAYLAKADLATLLVGEFPELQGVIGMHYAKISKEDAAVALAIQEHYLPRFESDQLPTSIPGICCSLSDKLDNLVGYFSVGIKPSSSSDPYALRRQTLGILKILIESEKSLKLTDLYNAIYENFENKSKSLEFISDLESFTIARLKTVFEEYGFKKDEIESCLTLTDLNPFDQYLRLKALSKFRKTDEFTALYEVFKRAKGQLQGVAKQNIQVSLLKEPAEKSLFEHIKSSEGTLLKALDSNNYEDAIKLLATFKAPLSKLYDEVKILDDDESTKNNRLALLQEVFSLFGQLLDFTKLQEHAKN